MNQFKVSFVGGVRTYELIKDNVAVKLDFADNAGGRFLRQLYTLLGDGSAPAWSVPISDLPIDEQGLRDGLGLLAKGGKIQEAFPTFSDDLRCRFLDPPTLHKL